MNTTLSYVLVKQLVLINIIITLYFGQIGIGKQCKTKIRLFWRSLIMIHTVYQVESSKCCKSKISGDSQDHLHDMSSLVLTGHLLRTGGTSRPCFSFTRFIVEQCLLKYMTLLMVRKLPVDHILLNTTDTKHTVMP